MTSDDASLRRGLRLASAVLGATVCLLGALVLVGWAWDVAALKSVVPGLVSMKPNTAVGFVSLGLAVAVLTRDDPAARLAGAALGSLVAILGAATLFQYAGGADLGIDQLLFRESAGAPRTVAPGRMSPNSAAAFLLAGLAVLLVAAGRAHALGEVLSGLVLLIGYQGLVGYALGVEVLYALPSATAMALHTSAGFLLAATGCLMLRPHRGAMALIADPGPAGVTLRLLLPAGLLLPLLAGLLAVIAVDHGGVPERFALSVVVSLVALVVVVAVALTAAEVRRVDRARLALLEAERRARRGMETAVRARDRTLAVVGHDLRAPLNTVVATTSLLLEGIPPTQEHPRYLRIVKRSADTMTRLIQDLLDAARLEEGTLRVSPVPTRLDRVVGETCESLDQVAARRRVRIRCDLDEAPVVDADPDRVRQILTNLLANAIRFTPEEGEVRVSVETAGDRVRVTVRDTGPGISAEDRVHLFEPFWQRDGGGTGGVGLGLYIVKALVDAHGGTVEVESTVGSGTAFRFSLPLAAEGSAAGAAAADPASP